MNYDPVAFKNAINFHVKSCGIGTLNERCLHSIVKYYADSDISHHEQKVCGYIADIFDGKTITEVQTRGFGALNKKLEAYLPHYNVNIIYPCACHKNIYWIDPENGEIVKKSHSSKTGDGRELLFEASSIRSHLTSGNLKFTVMLIDLDEYKLVNPRNKSRKHGTVRVDRVPRELAGIIEIDKPSDFVKLLPPGFPSGSFTANEFARAVGRRKSMHSSFSLNTLISTGVVEPKGYTGSHHARIYSLADGICIDK